ncbi:hypothetical protein PsYK624_150150 [Phanerochaete sordida]|uniref:Uncharacterized protein n=1 Tax=Phanerochaete sordida TaxID=48140 RepID=A0A9P3GSS6_9APHY|nr:hypothetical protein PsYK624_150150 [Phanerochaete sordida]
MHSILDSAAGSLWTSQCDIPLHRIARETSRTLLCPGALPVPSQLSTPRRSRSRNVRNLCEEVLLVPPCNALCVGDISYWSTDGRNHAAAPPPLSSNPTLSSTEAEHSSLHAGLDVYLDLTRRQRAAREPRPAVRKPAGQESWSHYAASTD